MKAPEVKVTVRSSLFARIALAMLRHVTLRDMHFYGGLAIAAAGGAMLSVGWTLVALGAALAIVGLRGVAS